jgi:hypothetical protein
MDRDTFLSLFATGEKPPLSLFAHSGIFREGYYNSATQSSPMELSVYSYRSLNGPQFMVRNMLPQVGTDDAKIATNAWCQSYAYQVDATLPREILVHQKTPAYWWARKTISVPYEVYLRQATSPEGKTLLLLQFICSEPNGCVKAKYNEMLGYGYFDVNSLTVRSDFLLQDWRPIGCSGKWVDRNTTLAYFAELRRLKRELGAARARHARELQEIENYLNSSSSAGDSDLFLSDLHCCHR